MIKFEIEVFTDHATKHAVLKINSNGGTPESGEEKDMALSVKATLHGLAEYFTKVGAEGSSMVAASGEDCERICDNAARNLRK